MKMLIYKRYPSSEEAQELIDLLNAHNIEYEIEDNSRSIADHIIGQDMESKVLVKINQSDFIRANELLEKQAQQEIEQVEKDYYLFSFENHELLEVLSEPDAWCDFDRQLAKKILKDRSVEISAPLEKAFVDKRIKELSKTEKGNSIWMIVGYVSALLGGLLGIAVGLNLWTSKRTLPDGSRVFVYTERDRFHGMIISIIGIFVFLMSVVIPFLYL